MRSGLLLAALLACLLVSCRAHRRRPTQAKATPPTKTVVPIDIPALTVSEKAKRFARKVESALTGGWLLTKVWEPGGGIYIRIENPSIKLERPKWLPHAHCGFYFRPKSAKDPEGGWVQTRTESYPYPYLLGDMGEYRVYAGTVGDSQLEAIKKALGIPFFKDKGGVFLETKPRGALIFIDGECRGKSPVTLVKMKPGKHKVKATLSGYENKIHTVQIVAGHTYPLCITLKPRKR